MPEELSSSVIAAIDQYDQMFALQEIIELCIEQFDEPEEKIQARVPLLLRMYLSALSYNFDELRTELERIRRYAIAAQTDPPAQPLSES